MKTLKLLFLLILTGISYFNVQAQQMEPVLMPQKFPEYPGGDEARQKFFIDHLVYPKEAKEKGIEMLVIVDLIIEEDGSFSDVKLLSFFEKNYGFGLGEEAIRVVNLMPKWVPGQIDGKNVRTRWDIPVQFSLDGTPYIYPKAIKQIKDYRYFSTEITDDSTNGFVRMCKFYYIKLYQDGRYEMCLSEKHSHKMYYDDEINEWIYSSMVLPNTMLSEGNYTEKDEILTLMDKNEQLLFEYQYVCDTIIRLPVFPNEIQMCLVPIQTFSFLNNIHFREE